MFPVVDQAFELLRQSSLPLNAVNRLTSTKEHLRVAAINMPGLTRVAVSNCNPQHSYVVLLKDFAASSNALPDLLEALGELLFFFSGEAGKQVWEKFLVAADPQVGEHFTAKLKSGQYSSYRALVESFGGVVERLVAIHIANAFIHYKVPIKDAFNVDVMIWPQTSALASGQKAYPLRPLVTAYCNPDTWKHFSVAFREHLTGTLKCGRQDVLTELRKVIEAVGGLVGKSA